MANCGKQARSGRRATLLRFLGVTLVVAVAAGCGDDGSSNGRASAPVEWRTIDGTGNNLAHPSRGSANTRLRRLVPQDYADGVSIPSGADRPNPRQISNIVCAQASAQPNAAGASNFIWQWGQFIDHDLDLTDVASPPEPFDIPIPAGDPVFDPESTARTSLPFPRSMYDLSTGTGVGNPRQQLNQLTAFIDASNVYGSDAERAAALRTFDGTGRLRTSDGNLLPFNTLGLPNVGGTDPSLFLGGDVRANEQIGLTTMHTLFMREHNRQADQLRATDPGLSDDEVYERARARVGALLQVITYRDFLPLLLGADAIGPYEGYQPDVDPTIASIFSAASYRLGHSLLAPFLLRLDKDGKEVSAGSVALRDAFFAIGKIIDEGGIEPLLRGLAAGRAQELDPLVVDDVRNFLFNPFDSSQGGFDLPAINVQRGRDHGLPDYNTARAALGLPRAESFADISSNPDFRQRLEAAYGDVDRIDIWVGGLAEDHVPGAMVGELIRTVVGGQFRRLRDGDRFWYQNVFSDRDLEDLENTTLADIIRRNTGIRGEIQDDVFHVP